MAELTPMGKIAVAAVALLIGYFFVFPALPGFLFPADSVERKTEIKVVAFLKTFDRDSAKLQETLREIKKDDSLQGLVSLSMINVEAEPEQLGQYNISKEEIPCFILGNQKFEGWHSKKWFEEKIMQAADLNSEKRE